MIALISSASFGVPHYCRVIRYVENLLHLASTVTGCVSISAFSSLADIPIGIKKFSVGVNIFAITAAIKKYKSIITKKKKKDDEIVLLGKDKLNAIEILSKVLIDS